MAASAGVEAMSVAIPIDWGEPIGNGKRSRDIPKSISLGMLDDRTT
jgi:hypothetical protein